MKKKTVVILLGNRLNDDGTISAIQEQRLILALEIEKEISPDYYILSGGLANPNAQRTEADAMYEFLIDKGIYEKKLIKEDKSLSTVQNAKYSVPIAKELGAEIIIVCTSPYHLGDPKYKAMESFVNELNGSNIVLMTYTK